MGAFLVYTGGGIIIGGCLGFVLAVIIISGKDSD